MKKVYIEGDDYGIKRMCVEDLGWRLSSKDMADVIVFSGGEDVSPHLYGEKNVASGNNKYRDAECIDLFVFAEQVNVPMIGICRGAQFLHVANGGSMWQDVNRHAIGGTHGLVDKDGSKHQVTSTHHQMMRLTAGEGDGYDGELIAWATGLATRKITASAVKYDPANGIDDRDIEVMWYPKTRSLCYQPHPEYGVKTCLDHFVKLLERFDLR